VTTSRLTDAEMRAWQALLHAHHDVIQKLDQELRREHDMPLAWYDVLLRLARAPDQALRMTDLAERVMLSPSGLTRLVDRLVARGLVQRTRRTPVPSWPPSPRRGCGTFVERRERTSAESENTSPDGSAKPSSTP
jgi:hypothetical protein